MKNPKTSLHKGQLLTKAAAKAAPTTAEDTTQAATALVVVAHTGALQTAPDADEFASEAAQGLENVTSRDLMIPRVTIIQALSPQLQKSKNEYIPGAAVGQFCDVAMKDVFDEFIFIPVMYQKNWIEWFPRTTGKGIAHIYSDVNLLPRTTQNDRKQNITDAGNILQETATFHVINLSAGGRKSYFSMTSSQLQASRRLLMKITSEKIQRADGSSFVPPLYYRSYKASVVMQSNNDGEWGGYQFESGPTILELDPSKGLLEEARSFYKMASEGLAKIDLAAAATEGMGDQENIHEDNSKM